MKREMTAGKKLLAGILILAMIFTMSACGGKDPEEAPPLDAGEDENIGVVDENEDFIEEGDEGIQYLNPEDLKTPEESDLQIYQDDIDGTPYKFGMKVSSDWTMSPTVERVAYDDLEGLQDTINAMLKRGLDQSDLGNFETWPEYEDYTGDDEPGIDRLVYSMGMENDDSDLGFVEVGAYHDSTDDSYYQYSVFFTDTVYDKDQFDAAQAAADIKSAYGVTVKESTLIKAFDTVWKATGESLYDYTIYEKKEVKGKDYTEKITMSINSMVMEDDTFMAYCAVERERKYQS